MQQRYQIVKLLYENYAKIQNKAEKYHSIYSTRLFQGSVSFDTHFLAISYLQFFCNIFVFAGEVTTILIIKRFLKMFKGSPYFPLTAPKLFGKKLRQLFKKCIVKTIHHFGNNDLMV